MTNPKNKTFDCVEMKRRIQDAILKELADVPPAERRRKTEELIESDPILARIWRNAPRVPAHRGAAPEPS